MLIFHGNPNAAQVTIVTLILLGTLILWLLGSGDELVWQGQSR